MVYGPTPTWHQHCAHTMLMLEDGTKLLSDLEQVDQLTAADVQAVAAATFREEWSIH